MIGMFKSAAAFNGDISGWDVNSVTHMSAMFYSSFVSSAAASTFNGDISGWDVSSVTDMYNMFHYAAAFNGDISVESVAGRFFIYRSQTRYTSVEPDRSQLNRYISGL